MNIHCILFDHNWYVVDSNNKVVITKEEIRQYAIDHQMIDTSDAVQPMVDKRMKSGKLEENQTYRMIGGN